MIDHEGRTLVNNPGTVPPAWAGSAPGSYRGEFLGVPSGFLRSAELEILILLGKGCDVWSLTERRTGVDVLWKPRWAYRPIPSSLQASNSETAWMDAVRGGMQIMTPNGGVTAGDFLGGAQPDHSEASVVPWAEVADPRAHTLVAQTWLTRSPLHLQRTFELLPAGQLRITDRITNQGEVSWPLAWTAHPSFHGSFVEPGCAYETNADSWHILPSGPSIGVEPSAGSGPWPHPDFLHAPKTGARSLMGWLEYPPGPAQLTITNPRLQLRLDFAWDAATLPYGWVFQEWRATESWPWFKSETVLAFEPATGPPARALGRENLTPTDVVLHPGAHAEFSCSMTLSSN